MAGQSPRVGGQQLTLWQTASKAAAATAFGFAQATGALTRVQTETQTFCGQLTSPGGGAISITGTDGTVDAIRIAQVRAFQQPANC